MYLHKGTCLFLCSIGFKGNSASYFKLLLKTRTLNRIINFEVQTKDVKLIIHKGSPL